MAVTKTELEALEEYARREGDMGTTITVAEAHQIPLLRAGLIKSLPANPAKLRLTSAGWEALVSQRSKG